MRPHVELITTAALPYQAMIAVKIPNAPPALVTFGASLLCVCARCEVKACSKASVAG